MKLNIKATLIVILLLLSFLFFKNLVYSKTDTVDTLLGSSPQGIAINPETNIAVIVIEKKRNGHPLDSDYVSIVDLDTQTAISNVPVGKGPRAVAIDRGLNIALVSNSKDDTVSVIDLKTYSLIKTISVGKKPEGIAINPSTHKAIVANHKEGTTSIIDMKRYKVVNTIAVGKEPRDVAVDHELNLALVVNEKDYNVSIIDLNTHQVIGVIQVGKKPQAIDINPETHIAAVVNEKDNSITVINLLTWQTFRIPVGKHPIDIVINQLDNRALVICDEDRSLLLIDIFTKTEINNYSLNKKPKGAAINDFTNIAAVIDNETDSITFIKLPNPVPEIISITQDNIQRGNSEITIPIEGNKFITSSVAYFNNHPLITNFIDNHYIQATIPVAMRTTPTKREIRVVLEMFISEKKL